MSTATMWWLIAGCAVVTFVLKAVGPVVTGGRALPGPVAAVLSLLAPALVAALVATQVFIRDGRLELSATAAGVAVAGLLLMLRLPALVAAGGAVLVTAALRIA